MDTSKVDRYVGDKWDDEIVPAARRIHPHPQQVADVRRRLGQARLHGRRGQADGSLGARAADPGHAGRGGAPGRPHAADLHRDPGGQRRQRRRLRAALRPPRQAAGDDRLGRRPRPVEAGDQGRQAVRPRRRRRRLRDLRLADRDPGAAGAGAAARALRGPDRGLRGVRQLRPARLRRPPGRRASASRRWWCAWTRAAATTTSCGARPRCAAWPAATSRSRC